MNKNVPNRITMARLFLAIVIFVLLSLVKDPTQSSVLFSWILGLFMVASFSDFLDGYLARKYNIVSTFGRIADPFVDKIMVTGSFTLLIPLTPFLKPWMVVIIIGREFLISGIRGFAESQGMEFPANSSGKIKAVIQFFTITYLLLFLGFLQEYNWAAYLAQGLIWLTVAITIGSAYSYLVKAKGIFQKHNAL